MADLGQGVGSEPDGSKAAVIVRNDTGNHFSPTVIMAAMTSKTDSKARLPTYFTLDSFTQLPAIPGVVRTGSYSGQAALGGASRTVNSKGTPAAELCSCCEFPAEKAP